VVSAAGAQLQTFTEENDLAALLEKLGVAT
jgi:hypothetical protein